MVTSSEAIKVLCGGSDAMLAVVHVRHGTEAYKAPPSENLMIGRRAAINGDSVSSSASAAPALPPFTLTAWWRWHRYCWMWPQRNRGVEELNGAASTARSKKCSCLCGSSGQLSRATMARMAICAGRLACGLFFCNVRLVLVDSPQPALQPARGQAKGGRHVHGRYLISASP